MLVTVCVVLINVLIEFALLHGRRWLPAAINFLVCAFLISAVLSIRSRLQRGSMTAQDALTNVRSASYIILFLLAYGAYMFLVADIPHPRYDTDIFHHRIVWMASITTSLRSWLG